MLALRILVFIVLIHCTPLAAEAVAIVNVHCVDNSLAAKSLKNVFLDKKSSWSDGGKITIYVHEADKTHADFLDMHVKKSPTQFNAFWKKKVFTGKGRMPDAYPDDAAMIAAVTKQTGSIGYIDRASARGAAGIKILEIKQ